MKLVKVKDSVGLHREINSGAIVNTSVDDYEKYMKRKEAALSQKKRLDKMEQDVSEIKSMLKELVSKS